MITEKTLLDPAWPVFSFLLASNAVPPRLWGGNMARRPL